MILNTTNNTNKHNKPQRHYNTTTCPVPPPYFRQVSEALIGRVSTCHTALTRLIPVNKKRRPGIKHQLGDATVLSNLLRSGIFLPFN